MRNSHDHARFFGLPRDNFDWALFLTASALAVIGVVNLYSATSVSRAGLSDIYIQQVYWLVLGGILGAVVAVIDYRHYERLGYVLYGIGIVLLVLVFILGKDIRGSSRWIQIGSFSFQPSEFMKLFMIIALAKYLHDDPKTDERSLKDLLIPALLAAIPTLLILKQPDLGTALILALIFGTICMLTKIRWQSLVTLVIAVGIAVPLLWTYVFHDYQKQRILVFLNPEANLLGSGWHAHHARVAIGAGGFSGEGFMRGTQNQFLFLPDQHSDFPFAVFAQDWGFLGCFLLVALYTFLVLWAVRIAATAKDRFGAVLAVGVGALIFWHAFFNLGMVTGILPVVGVTLPLFSAGGSSVLTIMLGMGLLMNVSMRRFYVSPSRSTGLLSNL
ncbi:MAG: rod shape-determining protein RodA [Polyangiaceae bacterium]|nr:rod shape-determining protein RodA [Polyangiaceae bacterium]